MSDSDYRIEFTITRRLPGERDFTEVGFGSSGAWANVQAALNDLDAIIQNGEWETTPGMPDPRSICHPEGRR